MKYILTQILFTIALFSACENKPDIIPPYPPDNQEVKHNLIDEENIVHSTILSAGEDNVHSYRIPAALVANDGSLLVFVEARRTTWVDRSYIDVAVKRSSDDGKSWMPTEFLTKSLDNSAFANPTPVIDRRSGKIFVWCCRWLPKDSGVNNRVYLITSSDNGKSWSEPVDMTESISPKGGYVWGFGPGSGLYISEGKYAGRMIVPMQQFLGDGKTGIVSLYSDDGGKTWLKGSMSAPSTEAQIAYVGDDLLVMNARASGYRSVTYSRDGGITWSARAKDSVLPAASKGCHASVLGFPDGELFFCGIGGGVASSSNDERYKLHLYRSELKGYSWEDTKEIWSAAASYTDMVMLKDGRLAVIYESADTQGFTLSNSRGDGWMRIDILVFPSEITNKEYWFNPEQ